MDSSCRLTNCKPTPLAEHGGCAGLGAKTAWGAQQRHLYGHLGTPQISNFHMQRQNAPPDGRLVVSGAGLSQGTAPATGRGCPGPLIAIEDPGRWPWCRSPQSHRRPGKACLAYPCEGRLRVAVWLMRLIWDPMSWHGCTLY